MNKLTEGLHFYLNEEGLIVFTEVYHLEKGFCCGMKCKHCPYQHKNVPMQNQSKPFIQPSENK